MTLFAGKWPAEFFLRPAMEPRLLALAEAALHGRWISDHIRQGSHADPISNEAKEGRIRPAVRLRPGGNKIALLQKDTDVEEAP